MAGSSRIRADPTITVPSVVDEIQPSQRTTSRGCGVELSTWWHGLLPRGRTIGARKQYIDKVNALAKSTYGALSEMPHKPGSQLPNTWADDFFLQDSQAAATNLTVADINEQITDLQQQLASAQELLATQQKAEAQANANKEAEAALEAQIAQAEKESAEAQQKIAVVKAKRGKR